jgi:23S rRNA (cytosine1962-C5)-methyltransferase
MSAPTSPRPRIYLLPGRDKRIGHGHPWAYSNEVRMDAEAKALPPGAIVSLHRIDGKPLGTGSFNPHALIAFRLFARNPDRALDAGFIEGRLRRALDLRQRLFAEPYYRLIHAEADGLPGLVVDRFGAALVVQANTAGADALAEEVVAGLDAVLAPEIIVLRNDTPARASEGLERSVSLAKGRLDGPVEVRENGVVYAADLLAGQKTGWFFDQRDNRSFIAHLAKGWRLLDAYCHSGGFAVAAAAAGASGVLGIESSEPALALAARAASANTVTDRCSFRRAQVFEALEGLGAERERFSVVVADPPAFVKSRKDLATGLRGYRKLARLAAAVVAPGGILFAASCSHNVEPAAFAGEVVRGIAAAGRSGRIIRAAGAAPDHPIHPHLPESAYLKTLTLHLD